MIEDVWARVNDLDSSTLLQLVDVLETRGKDPSQQEMRRQFLASIPFPGDGRVLEVGCGTGIMTERLVSESGASLLLAVDYAPQLMTRARSRLAEKAGQFVEADARLLPIQGDSFDVVVIDSCLAHVPHVARAVEEAMRVLRPGGRLAIFEGDYASATVALGDFDPLQTAIDAAMALTATDKWIVRNISGLVRRFGGVLQASTVHPYVDISPDGYMMSLIDRGAASLAADGLLLTEEASALQQTARDRASSGRFFGVINYAGFVFLKPD